MSFDLYGELPTGTTVLEASAGTGKTWTIAALATRYLAEGQVELSGLMLATFSRAATQELRERVRELGLEERIAFVGFRRDLPRLFEAMDIVCVPSRNEAFGLTVIEAMAAGKAVVGSDSGAIPELVDPATGRLAAPDDPAAWGRALAELADDVALREALGEASRQRVERDFTLEKHVAGLVAAYAEAA
jgi:glycosyltransferase involved in cell wall biosynthesis